MGNQSFVNTEKAGLLTCNIFIVLPADCSQWTLMDENFGGYLQLRDSS
jgi:hypothetical protein